MIYFFMQLQTFQYFLDWFRSRFPYYHDKCDSCGVACKDDPVQSAETLNGDVGEDTNNEIVPVDIIMEKDEENTEQTHESEEDDFSFLGYQRPTSIELLGNASRTELYRCRTCQSFTRFPRYNKALWIATTQRGRCGEYSMLLYRMLRSLGYEKLRWVVDWADHVWAEVWVGSRWVHLDPCEAAVDNPLLYQSWGKNQTFIVAFHDTLNTRGGQENGIDRFATIEDVTHRYTSDQTEVITERRGISEDTVAKAIEEVSKSMANMLQDISS
jgi:hypothetical protein